MSNRILVAGIDFGTTYSGYAYSFNHEYNTDPLKINISKLWSSSASSRSYYKTPTCILYPRSSEEDGNTVYFGYDAEEKFTELKMDGKEQDWYFFKEFKMHLYNKKNLNRNTELECCSSGARVPAIEVFAKAIKYLKGNLMETIRKDKSGITDEDIFWVITVPAIWDDNAKQFMLEAAGMAGLKREDTVLALEPEAASLYCRSLPIDKFSSWECSEGGLEVSRPGSVIMTLDAGGGTVDVTLHKVTAGGGLAEVYKASGGAWGGTRVDKEFTKRLQDLFGVAVFEEFASSHPDQLLELMQNFEHAKRLISSSSDKEWVYIYIPCNLRENRRNTSKVDEVKWAGDKLGVKKDVILSLFQPAVDSIISHVGEILSKPQSDDLSAIFMVGGFSECLVLQESLKKEFPLLSNRIRVPKDAWLAVMQGAVIFGHQQDLIVERVSRRTYGIRTHAEFDEDSHDASKLETIEGVDYCRDIFDTFIEVDVAYKNNQRIGPKTYVPIKSDQTGLRFPVYSSPFKDVNYTTDEGCINPGGLSIDFEGATGDDRAARVTFIVGGTMLEIEAINCKTGKKVNAYFDFLSS